MLGRLSFFLLALLLYLAPASTPAQDLIIDRAVLQDIAGKLSIDEVAKAEFTPIGPMFNAGYTNKVHWFRLHLRPPSDGRQIELRIRPTYLDEFLLF